LEVCWGRRNSLLANEGAAKQLRSQRKRMGVERERVRDGVAEARRARLVLGVHPI
jgi:hypothetical protein